MKIKSILIENYKSIKHLSLSLTPKLNIFIGENSVGKSNIFNAIFWLLGPTYPSLNNVGAEDYYKGDSSKSIKIRLNFDDGNYLELADEWRDSRGNVKKGLNLNGNYVTDDVRNKYVSSIIGTERKVLDNSPSNRWSILGRLLLDINERFNNEKILVNGEDIPKKDLFINKIKEIRDDILFSVKDDNGDNVMQKFIHILQTETARQLNRNAEEFSIDLNLYDPWNFYRTLLLLVNETDLGMKFKASELGMGVQASITIAILKAYSQIKLKNNTPIFIDEPELFLHPQGRRNFYKIIKELADNGTQVFLTTHSSEFISLDRFDEIYVVRKSPEKGTYVRNANPSKFIEDLQVRCGIKSSRSDLMLTYKNAYENTGDSQKASEGMFARKVILVEGESESLILPYFFDLIGYDYIAEGITIVRCGGKSELDRFYRLYSEYGIVSYIIFDGDKQNIGTDDESFTIKKNHDILSIFGEQADFPDGKAKERYLGFETRLEDNLGKITGVGRDVKALRLYKKVKDEIKNKNDVPSWVFEVIEKINKLPNEAESILKKFD